MAKKPVKVHRKKIDPGPAADPIDPEKQAKAAKPAPAKQELSKTGGLKPWLSFRSGLIIITVCSVGMGIITAVTYVPVIGWAEGLLYAAGYTAVVWGIFFLSQLFYRWLRK